MGQGFHVQFLINITAVYEDFTYNIFQGFIFWYFLSFHKLEIIKLHRATI